MPLLHLPPLVGHAIYCLLLHGNECILYSGSVLSWAPKTGCSTIGLGLLDLGAMARRRRSLQPVW